MDRYNKFNTFLKNKFGERVLKVCIDGGFTCPNRDGKCGVGGCIFCGEKGSGEHIRDGDISSQVRAHLSSYRGDRADKFIAYFQNFSNTYADVSTLKAKYDSALVSDKIVALAIATRPDCITEEIAQLLASYRQKGLYVWVELGLQTINPKVGEFINRGYTNEDFDRALAILNQYDIDVVSHIMIGLPRQEPEDIANMVEFVNARKIKGIKLHSTYVIAGTALEKMYNKGEYTPIEMDEYIDNVLFVLTHLREDIVVHRITGDAPKDLLIAPKWSAHKKLVMNRIENVMASDNLHQGIYYKK